MAINTVKDLVEAIKKKGGYNRRQLSKLLGCAEVTLWSIATSRQKTVRGKLLNKMLKLAEKHSIRVRLQSLLTED